MQRCGPFQEPRAVALSCQALESGAGAGAAVPRAPQTRPAPTPCCWNAPSQRSGRVCLHARPRREGLTQPPGSPSPFPGGEADVGVGRLRGEEAELPSRQSGLQIGIRCGQLPPVNAVLQGCWGWFCSAWGGGGGGGFCWGLGRLQGPAERGAPFGELCFPWGVPFPLPFSLPLLGSPRSRDDAGAGGWRGEDQPRLGGWCGAAQSSAPALPGGGHRPGPPPGRQDQGHRVQALAARALQEGRWLRFPARLRCQPGARVLFLLQVRGVQQQGLSLPARRGHRQHRALSLVRPRLLLARSPVQVQAHEEGDVCQLPGGLLPRGTQVQIRAPQGRADAEQHRPIQGSWMPVGAGTEGSGCCRGHGR